MRDEEMMEMHKGVSACVQRSTNQSFISIRIVLAPRSEFRREGQLYERRVLLSLSHRPSFEMPKWCQMRTSCTFLVGIWTAPSSVLASVGPVSVHGVREAPSFSSKIFIPLIFISTSALHFQWSSSEGMIKYGLCQM